MIFDPFRDIKPINEDPFVGIEPLISEPQKLTAHQQMLFEQEQVKLVKDPFASIAPIDKPIKYIEDSTEEARMSTMMAMTAQTIPGMQMFSAAKQLYELPITQRVKKELYDKPSAAWRGGMAELVKAGPGGAFLPLEEQEERVESVRQAAIKGYQDPESVPDAPVTSYVKKLIVPTIKNYLDRTYGEVIEKAEQGTLTEIDVRRASFAKGLPILADFGIDISLWVLDRPLDFILWKKTLAKLGFGAASKFVTKYSKDVALQKQALQQAVITSKVKGVFDKAAFKGAVKHLSNTAETARIAGGEAAVRKSRSLAMQELVKSIKTGRFTDAGGNVLPVTGPLPPNRLYHIPAPIKELRNPLSNAWKRVDDILHAPMKETFGRELKPGRIYGTGTHIQPFQAVLENGEKNFGTGTMAGKIQSSVRKMNKHTDKLSNEFHKALSFLDGDEPAQVEAVLAKEGLIPKEFISEKAKRALPILDKFFRRYKKVFGIESNIKNYFPHTNFGDPAIKRVISKIAKAKRPVNKVLNVHELKRLGKEGYTLDPFEAHDTYIRRTLRTKFLDPVMKEIAPKVSKLPEPLKEQFIRYEEQILGRLLQEGSLFKRDVAIMLKQIPGLTEKGIARTANELSGLMRDVIYSSGLGRPEAWVKNTIQGIVHNPTKLGFKYTMVGHYRTHTASGVARLKQAGILKQTAAPFMEGPLGTGTISKVRKGLKWFSKPFAAVDTWPNRGVMYLGADQKFMDTFHWTGLKGVQKLLREVPLVIRNRIGKLLPTLDPAKVKTPVGKRALLEASDIYATFMQHTGHYPYGKFLGPQMYSASNIGRTAGIFGTWPLYFSEFVKTMTPIEAARYTATATLVGTAAYRAGLNIWNALFLGSLPTSFGGPVRGLVEGTEGALKFTKGMALNDDYLKSIGGREAKQLMRNIWIFVPEGLLQKQIYEQMNLLLDDLNVRDRRTGKIKGKISSYSWYLEWIGKSVEKQEILKKKKKVQQKRIK